MSTDIKPIRYFTPFDDVPFTGYLVKREGNLASIATPICFDWLNHINRLDEIKNVNLMLYFLDDVVFDCPIKKIENVWFFEFPLTKEDISLLNSISIFFEYIQYSTPQTIVKDLIRALGGVSSSLPKDTRRRLVKFTEKHLSTNANRLELLLSEDIQKYL